MKVVARTGRGRRCWLILASVALVASCSADRPSTSQGAQPAARISSFDGELPPLPKVQFASARPAPLTRGAYEFAGRHGDVLRRMPCFCGCERNGHRSNEDCFVAKREADGRPAWSPHGIGCGICIDVAQEAMRMHGAGASLADIRAAIDRRYRSEYPSSTPTPPVH